MLLGCKNMGILLPIEFAIPCKTGIALYELNIAVRVVSLEVHYLVAPQAVGPALPSGSELNGLGIFSVGLHLVCNIQRTTADVAFFYAVKFFRTTQPDKGEGHPVKLRSLLRGLTAGVVTLWVILKDLKAVVFQCLLDIGFRIGRDDRSCELIKVHRALELRLKVLAREILEGIHGFVHCLLEVSIFRDRVSIFFI